MPVTPHAAVNDLTLQHVERDKQRGCAVALVIVGLAPQCNASFSRPAIEAPSRPPETMLGARVHRFGKFAFERDLLAAQVCAHQKLRSSYL